MDLKKKKMKEKVNTTEEDILTAIENAQEPRKKRKRQQIEEEDEDEDEDEDGYEDENEDEDEDENENEDEDENEEEDEDEDVDENENDEEEDKDKDEDEGEGEGENEIEGECKDGNEDIDIEKQSDKDEGIMIKKCFEKWILNLNKEEKDEEAYEKTIEVMMKKRGYVPVQRHAYELHPFQIYYGTKENDTYVCFYTKEKLGIGNIREIEEFCLQQLIPTEIVFVTPGITPAAKKTIQASSLLSGANVFSNTELTFDYTDHCLIPQHIPLGKEEADIFLQTYRLKREQLAILPRTDPVAKFFGFTPDTIVKIRRVYGDAVEPHDYYRIVK
jgi:DNA-directed RNA polymerase subunit H (RpoH/RPB5)